MIDAFEKHLEELKAKNPDFKIAFEDKNFINMLKQTYAKGYFLCLDETQKIEALKNKP